MFSFGSKLMAQDYFMSNAGETITTCGGNFYDSGGPGGNYADGEFGQITFCSDDPNLCIRLDFLNVDIESGFEQLTIFAGPDAGGTVLGTITGAANNISFSAPGSCITVVFTADGIINFTGWNALINCVDCPTCSDGIMNGLENGVDCGGDCPSCPCADLEVDALPFDFSGTTCGFGPGFDWTDLCQNFNMDGQDVTFLFVPEQDGCYSFELSGFMVGSAGMMLTEGCPDDMTGSCVMNLVDNWVGTMSGIAILEGGTEYYLTIGSANWMANCIDFDLSIENDCPQLSPADCFGAIPVCQEAYSETLGPQGSGNFPTEFNPFGCNFSETNSIWYTFTVQEDGMLNFIIEPNNLNDDYDWALFDLTEFGCEDIPSTPAMEVSCNSWGVIGVNGNTGISTANGGVGNNNGPGNLNGPPFNADLPVSIGETYALCVMNWSNSFQGYDLNFAGSSASIFDQVPPTITDVELGCGGTELILTFSEPVLCETVEAASFNLEGPGGSVIVDNVNSGNCEFGSTTTETAVIFLGQGLEPGDYLINGNGAQNVTDACDNIIVGDFAFVSSEIFTVEPDVTNACSPGQGAIDVSNVQGGLGPFVFSLDGAEDADGVFTGLDAGTYEIDIVDAGGCSLNLEVEVLGLPLDADAGEDAVPCDMVYQLNADASNGDYLWSGPAQVSFSDLNSLTSTVTADEPGTYLLTLTVSSEPCETMDQIEITFNEPIVFGTQVEHASCHDFCDGSITFNPSSGTGLQYSISGGNLFSANPAFDELCAGTYDLVVIDNSGCNVTAEVSVFEPPMVVAGFDASPAETYIPYTEIQFTNLSQNYDSSQWYFGDVLGMSNEDSPFFTFPQESGDIYPVTLVVFDENGCRDSLTRFIIINNDFQVFVPNSFSPNGDGNNEIFIPVFSSDPGVYEIKIFDRWGEIVFESLDPTEPWIGNVNGGDYFVESGVYQWIMRTGRNSIEAADYSGHIVVIR
jgi:gliding motility-associated-like protein